jgi:hypothetical protein
VIAALALLASLTMPQDTTALSPRAQAMLRQFPPPAPGEVSVATRFSAPSAWVGEQVELVTAAWFPRELRERLRRQPTLRAPSLSGLWSVQAQPTPQLAETRMVRGRVYDLFVMHQTLFPLGDGTITAPSAILSYAVPTSVSFFAPEDRKSLSSRPATLAVRSVPASLASELGSGPTARGMRMEWRLSANGFRVGTPGTVELVLRGTGNAVLWPTPEIAWPAGLRVYPEPTRQVTSRVAGLFGGEKRFVFTLVPDSVGVIPLPRVRYPYFDPSSVSVVAAAAAAVGVAVLPALPGSDRPLLPVTDDVAESLAERGLPLALALSALATLLMLVPRRRGVRAVAAAPSRPEDDLLQLVARLADGREDVGALLRRHGVTADDAEAVAQWLVARDASKYGLVRAGAAPEIASVASRVLGRIRRIRRVTVVVLLLLAAASALPAQDAASPVARYRGGDPAGAERGFAEQVGAMPHAVAGWRNLAAARWRQGDDAGAAAAWLRALELAPRDPLTRSAWEAASTIPADVRARAPRVPISATESLLLASVLAPLTAWAWRTRRRRAMWIGGVLLAAALVHGTEGRWQQAPGRVLVRRAEAMRVSPVATAPTLAAAPRWASGMVERREGEWVLVTLANGARGWLPLDAAAGIGPLD